MRSPGPESAENLALMELIDKEYTARPFRGSGGMSAWLRREGHEVNRKEIEITRGTLCVLGGMPQVSDGGKR